MKKQYMIYSRSEHMKGYIVGKYIFQGGTYYSLSRDIKNAKHYNTKLGAENAIKIIQSKSPYMAVLDVEEVTG